jgi:hypothetical protein
MVDPSLRRRAGVAAVLAVFAAVLLILVLRTESPHRGTPVNRPLIASVDSLVDAFLKEKGIDRGKERKWPVRNPGGDILRIERRIAVPRERITLELNRDLNQAVESMGGHVAGTERTKASTVVLHIVVRGMTVHTLTIEPELQQSQ